MHTNIAVVTGASSGIGRACAHALVAQGWTTICVGRDAQKLQDTIAALPSEHRGLAQAMQCDVTDPDAVQALFDDVYKRYGHLDLLFNNAGINQRVATPDEVSAVEWRNVLATNLDGAFYCLSHAFRIMRAQSPQGGRIINNGSISAHVPRPSSISYAASKAAVTGLTRGAALDGRPFNIAVGQIDVGNVASAMTEKMASGVLQADGSVRAEARMEMSSVATTFMAMVNLPLDANIFQVTVMATGMPYVGRG
ncbi:MAG: SDR family oxidoreductase [Burkholderiaceae bacterium]|jgi:NAD(P)-dependent dehydrogenase (short-subunit alcohol dehydrogenase family)|tara:strand:- start:2379 stop:3134 length:756 start_codon:yes stop_codon:yes gene_type:complete